MLEVTEDIVNMGMHVYTHRHTRAHTHTDVNITQLLIDLGMI